MGMPPIEFVRWRRRSKVGAYLFSHKTNYFKTIDRKVYYTGEGILGRGFFRQGVLANRYLINALAALTSRPELLLQMFATTKQEDNGRFSVRFFEGSGWRSVYIGTSYKINFHLFVVLFVFKICALLNII